MITACPYQPWHGGKGETVVTAISLLMASRFLRECWRMRASQPLTLKGPRPITKALLRAGEKTADEDPIPKAFYWWTEASENGSPGNWPTWPWSSNADSARAALRGETASSPRLRLLSGKYRTKRCVLVPFHDTGKIEPGGGEWLCLLRNP